MISIMETAKLAIDEKYEMKKDDSKNDLENIEMRSATSAVIFENSFHEYVVIAIVFN